MRQLHYAILAVGLLLVWLVVGCGGTSPAPTVPSASNTAQGPGRVRVLAFDDLNGDGKRDVNEPGIQAQIGLAKGTSCPSVTDLVKAKTGTDGTYIFNDVKPGAYCVGLFESLAMTSPGTVPIFVKAGQESPVQFAILASR